MAMDFSGQESRVIENPSEALSVAVEEGLSWRVSSLQTNALKVFSKSYIELGFVSPAEEELSPSEHPRESLHVTELSLKHR